MTKIKLGLCLLFVVVTSACGGGNHTFRDPSAPMNQACVASAQSQLTPYWAQMSRAERTVMAMRVVTECEGQ